MKVNVATGRWYAKKTSRAAMVLGSWGSGSLLLRGMLRKPRVRVLTYHRFGGSTRDPFCVSRRDFERQVAWLAKNQLAVSLSDVEAFVQGKRTLSHGSVLITIDDGVRSVLTEALPILRDYDVPAVAYIVSEMVGADGAGLPEAFMTWNDLEQLANSKIEIGSHSCTHRSMAEISEEECRREANESKRTLEARLGRHVTSFAYPYGTPLHYSQRTERIVEQAGYRTVFISTHGALRQGLRLTHLPRVKVEGGEPLWMFKQLCRGGMDSWTWVDNALSLSGRLRRGDLVREKRDRSTLGSVAP